MLSQLKNYGQLVASERGKVSIFQGCDSWEINYTLMESPTPEQLGSITGLSRL